MCASRNLVSTPSALTNLYVQGHTHTHTPNQPAILVPNRGSEIITHSFWLPHGTRKTAVGYVSHVAPGDFISPDV